MQTIINILSAPFGWVMAIFYNMTGTFMLSVFLLTILVKLCLIPSAIKQQKGQAKQARLQPKLRKIQQKYQGNPQKIQEATSELYAREGYSAMTAGCLPMLIQLPIMMALFQINYHPLSMVLRIPKDVVAALSAAATPLAQAASSLNPSRLAYQMEIHTLTYFDQIDKSAIAGLTDDMIQKIQLFSEKFSFLGMNLAEVPDVKNFSVLWAVPIVSGVIALAMSIYSLMQQKKMNPEMAKNPSMGCMMLFTPIMQVWFGFMFPVGVGLYTIFSVIISFAQMILLNHFYSPKKVLAKIMVEETIYRRSKEKNMKKIAEMKEDAE